MSLENNKRLARLYFEGLNNPALYYEILADDFTMKAIHGKYGVVINDNGERGPAAFKGFAAEMKATWSDVETTLDEVVAEGDRVFVLWTFRGTQIGPFLGIPPTGKRVTYSGFNLFRVADGRLVEGWDMMDRLSLWQGLGVLPPTREFLEQAQKNGAPTT